MIRAANCPICQKPLDNSSSESARFHPFCSQRCRQIDFFRWCDGKYSIVEQIPPEQWAELQTDDFLPEADL